MKEFPESFIQCGIAEANMIGIAAGLTIGGKNSLIPQPLQILVPEGYMTRYGRALLTA